MLKFKLIRAFQSVTITVAVAVCAAMLLHPQNENPQKQNPAKAESVGFCEVSRV